MLLCWAKTGKCKEAEVAEYLLVTQVIFDRKQVDFRIH
jgi:hypothetical protein